jgi:GNAT superfamily N-acetyltransferase
VVRTSHTRHYWNHKSLMVKEHGNYQIDDDLARVDFDRVHAWLASSYWSPGVPREKVQKAAQGSSLVVGAYLHGKQAGYMRVVSDRATFAWLCDVFVDEAHRGQGLAKAMVRYAQEHPEHQGLRRWLLATKDAHEVYRSVGFETLPTPEKWMTYIPEPGAYPQPGD